MVNKILTQYGVDNASELMNGFHEIGNNLLSELLQYYSSPNEKKTLKMWKMKDACKMIGRSEAFLRKLEQEHPIYTPSKDQNGTRQYSLNLINRIRDFTKTRIKRPENSEPIILSISNFKGGVAKSTTTLHFIQKCALIGLRCLVIDLDPQATLSLGFGYVPDINVKESDTIKSALTESPKNILDIFQKTYFDGIDIIPGNLSLSNLEMSLTDLSFQKTQLDKLGMPNLRLKSALDVLSTNYDVIALDCGPNLGMLTINAVSASNALLVPIPPMMSDLGSFVTFTGTLSILFEQMQKSFDFFRILLTKHPESKESKQLELLIRQRFGTFVMQKNIVSSVEVEKASSIFSSIYETQNKSTKSLKRALGTFDNVFYEIFDAFISIWETQSNTKIENIKYLKEMMYGK